jgi:hypothetical protein
MNIVSVGRDIAIALYMQGPKFEPPVYSPPGVNF